MMSLLAGVPMLILALPGLFQGYARFRARKSPERVIVGKEARIYGLIFLLISVPTAISGFLPVFGYPIEAVAVLFVGGLVVFGITYNIGLQRAKKRDTSTQRY
jgi:hypothetical protein